MPSETSPVDLEAEQADTVSSTSAPHPEEMKGSITFKLGSWGSVTATGRATPAGLICAAALACAVLIPIAIVVRRK